MLSQSLAELHCWHVHGSCSKDTISETPQTILINKLLFVHTSFYLKILHDGEINTWLKIAACKKLKLKHVQQKLIPTTIWECTHFKNVTNALFENLQYVILRSGMKEFYSDLILLLIYKISDLYTISFELWKPTK